MTSFVSVMILVGGTGPLAWSHGRENIPVTTARLKHCVWQPCLIQLFLLSVEHGGKSSPLLGLSGWAPSWWDPGCVCFPGYLSWARGGSGSESHHGSQHMVCSNIQQLLKHQCNTWVLPVFLLAISHCSDCSKENLLELQGQCWRPGDTQCNAKLCGARVPSHSGQLRVDQAALSHERDATGNLFVS